MPKPFAAFDVDGTIFKSSLAEKVVDGCIEAGVFRAEPFNDVFANRRRWQISNNEGLYQAYLHRLVGAFVNEVAGVEVGRFNKVTDAMLERHAIRKFAFPRKLIRGLQPSHHIVAISGSPDILVKPFLNDLEVEAAYGSIFDVEDGVFTGLAKTVGNKATLLEKLVTDGVAAQSGSVAMGDTVSDTSMLEYSATPIMFNASRTLTNYGSEFGWLRVNEVKDQITALHWNQNINAYMECSPDEVIDRLVHSGAAEA